MAPFNLTADWGTWISYLVPLLIGIGFGATLEMSGFGDSRKLAGQFYLKDMTVLKVMFAAIVVAASLLAFFSAVGWLDFPRVFVNHTFLLPGIMGGLIMGVGFIIGGFCPGTSLVASSTLKIDGVFFVLGVSFGIFMFGETVGLYDGFWNSTALGRFTLAELFDIDHGVVVTGAVVMALFMFLAAEVLEDYFGKKVPARKLRFFPTRKSAWVAGSTLLIVALASAVIGQPTPQRKWTRIADQKQNLLDNRDVYVHPIEVAELTQDTAVYTRIFDVRSEADYNLFHLKNSSRATLDQLEDPDFVRRMKEAPTNTVFFTISNDEAAATEGWKLLIAQGVPNVYIVDGGINHWLDLYPPPPCLAKPLDRDTDEDELAYTFFRSAGDCCNSAYPEVRHKRLPMDCFLSSHPDSSAHSSSGAHEPEPPKVDFERKVKLKKKAAVKGGCG